MSKLSITEASEKAGISLTQCRYWSKLLEIEITKEGRISYIPAGSENMLSAMKQTVESGISPSVAAVEVKATYAPPPPVEQKTIINNDITIRLEQLERSVLLLAESNRKLSEENKSLAALIQAQNKKLENLSEKLLPAPQSKPLHVWQPTEKKAPQVSWLKRAWLELINPVKLRATP